MKSPTTQGILAERKKKRIVSRSGVFFITIALLFLLFFLMLPAIVAKLKCAEMTLTVYNLKRLSDELQGYEETHGKLPQRLDELKSQNITSTHGYDHYFQRTKNMNGMWWYNIGSINQKTKALLETPLIITPEVEGKQAYLRHDGSIKFLLPEALLKFMVEQDSTWIPIMGVEPLK